MRGARRRDGPAPGQSIIRRNPATVHTIAVPASIQPTSRTGFSLGGGTSPQRPGWHWSSWSSTWVPTSNPRVSAGSCRERCGVFSPSDQRNPFYPPASKTSAVVLAHRHRRLATIQGWLVNFVKYPTLSFRVADKDRSQYAARGAEAALNCIDSWCSACRSRQYHGL